MLSTQSTLVKKMPFISFHNMVKSNFWHREVRIISAALWNWLPRTSTETGKCYLRSNLNHWCGDAGAGYVSLMWKEKLSQHWQCTEQLWTILKLLQCRREMEVCFHVLLLAPCQSSDKDIWTPWRFNGHLLRPRKMNKRLRDRMLKDERIWDGHTRFI